VIPLKIIIIELKLNLEKDITNGELTSLQDLDEEILTEYVNKLIQNLESFIYTKNRLSLYHKEGIGLSIALD